MVRPFAAPRWRIDLTRVVLSGIGSIVVLWIAGWPREVALSAVAVALGGLLGYGGALALEWIARLRGEVVRLQGIEQQAAAERTQATAIKQQLEWQLQVAQREKLISEVHMKVYAGAFREGGLDSVPFPAIMARIDAESIAAGLNIPLQRPEV
jgi:hypothetical protein